MPQSSTSSSTLGTFPTEISQAIDHNRPIIAIVLSTANATLAPNSPQAETGNDRWNP